MSKQDPSDYDLSDVRAYVAEANGYKLWQLPHLLFPVPDYIGADGVGYWTLDTVYAWLNSLHTAMALTEIMRQQNQGGQP